jgi:hypothetical protein
MKARELSLGQTIYVEFDKGSIHKGIVVKINDFRLFCGTPTIKYYDDTMDGIYETSLENVYLSKIALYEDKLKKMEEEKNKYIEDYATKTIEIRNKIKKLQENEG